MTVWPGFGGQTFMRDCLRKIEILADHMDDEQWLEVDGGINLETAAEVASAGADTLVAGSAIFDAPGLGAAVGALRRAAERALRAREARSET
jgi:ribulose-phosphate 3-epimerase